MANSASIRSDVQASKTHWKMAPKRKALVDHVVEEVRQAILRGDYPVGSEIPTAERLGEAFGVSMTVVREAMRSLRSQGLVEVHQGRRPQVAAVDSAAALSVLGMVVRRAGSMRDLMQVRWGLEVEIAGHAAKHASDDQIAALEKAIDEMRDGTTLERQVEADVRFHRILAESTGNPLFPLLMKSLEGLLRELRRRTVLATGILMGLEEHAAIMEAIRAHDAEAAREAMVQHMRLAEKSLDVEEC